LAIAMKTGRISIAVMASVGTDSDTVVFDGGM
jgi:hypothetical protein